MFEEPYRWVEAIQNRRDYLQEQLSGGSPVVALPYDKGILFATVGKGSAKLFEIYDLIALGGIGHPADLEKLRNVVLDISHVEGFNRSPGDVTIRRLMKFGLAPMVKQAFEEVLHAPYIVKILMAEISPVSGKRLFFRLNYDGVFDEADHGMVLAGDAETTKRMESYFETIDKKSDPPLKKTLQAALRLWAISISPSPDDEKKAGSLPGNGELDRLLKKHLKDHEIELAFLDQTQAGSAKFRISSQKEIQAGLKGWL
ncbi:MAG: proteasome subunit alpha [Nitrospira sp.]|nr:proteasome subunit alpha [Candidatus Manganitrophaceae bacterium]HIL34020.1 proteasome subunit alpha [Candidatus Manganitrophaceae bacterium]